MKFVTVVTLKNDIEFVPFEHNGASKDIQQAINETKKFISSLSYRELDCIKHIVVEELDGEDNLLAEHEVWSCLQIS